MTIAPHAIIGAAAGTLTGNLWLAFLFGLISHFLADATPHVEPKFLVKKDPITGVKKWSPWLYVFVAFEFIVTVFVLYSFRHRLDYALILAGALGGLFPDFIANNPFLQKYRSTAILSPIFRFHDFIHRELPLNLWFISLVSELLLLSVGFWLLAR